ncbi:MAG TPA: isochorismate synthase [Candidatus Hydrogenedentes bacterium]|mgnify:CR=1 FL=1|nr:isochorismate synthase [Candidatus Hydrogenedentota bacterium]
MRRTELTPGLNEQTLTDVLNDAVSLEAEAPYAARIEIPVEEKSPRRWLAAQPHAEKIYWRDRDGVFECACLGAADCLFAKKGGDPETLFAKIAQWLTLAHPRLRYYGGFCFDPGRPVQDPWKAFGAYRFILPRFELLRMGETRLLACNALIRGDADADRREIEAVRAGFSLIRWNVDDWATPDAVSVVNKTDNPKCGPWTRRVNGALRACEAGRFDKVVLARRTDLRMNGPVSPWRVLDRLANHTRGAYLFCFQPEPGTAFLGASPERLWKRAGGYVQSEAVAGTRPRGGSSTADRELGDALMHNDKELREHRFVAEGVRSVLQLVCDTMREDDGVSLIRLPNCQHLARRYEGLLADGYEDLDLLRAFHPTPAVGGTPSGEALAWIRETEPFSRGWYAAPVGWIGYDSSEFAVAIRSGLIVGDRVHAFAGAGIVPGSVAAAEWDELNNKIQPFLDATSGHAE